MDVKIDHIVIGVGRCGTTSLSSYLEKHPNLNYSSIKELHFFSLNDQYEKGEPFLDFHYPKKENKPKSTCDTYLFLSEEGIQRLKQHNPKVRITVLVRNPVDRAFSSFLYAKHNGYQNSNLSFQDSLLEDEQYRDHIDIIKKTNYCHFYGSKYAEILSRWFAVFDENQIQILSTDQLKKDSQHVIDEVSKHIGVDTYKIESESPKNAAVDSKSKYLQQFLVNRNHWARRILRYPFKIKAVKKLAMSLEIGEKLKQVNSKPKHNVETITVKEVQFCEGYFKEDLLALKNQYQIEFKDSREA